MNLDPQFSCNETSDLSLCDQEPIHIPGAIQPHGVLLVLDNKDFRLLQVSDNFYDFFGVPAKSALGQDAKNFFGEENFKKLKERAEDNVIDNNPLHVFTAPCVQKGAENVFNAIVHRKDGLLILELEQASESNYFANELHYYNYLRQVLLEFGKETDFQQLLITVARCIKEVSGFDRVMVYKFDGNGDGCVIVDERESHLEAYLGLRYPATDIPGPARQLFLKKWLRLIPTIHYQEAKLIPELNPETQQPVDMSYVTLRHVSPIHLQYLANMGVEASMTITLTKEGKLWGLIAAHHYSCKYIPYEVRTICEFIGQYLSFNLYDKEKIIDARKELAINTKKNQLLHLLTKDDNYSLTHLGKSPLFYEFIEAQGAAILMGEKISLYGETPTKDEILGMYEWLDRSFPNEQKVLALDNFITHYPQAKDFIDKAAGVLIICLSKKMGNYIIWFRKEMTRIINWAGNPNKPYDGTNIEHLTPRKSFALWQEKVGNTSLPWHEWEIKAVRELKDAIIYFILNRVQEIIKISEELKKSNLDLDSFAYVTSHDLKEPLRGIHNYSSILLRDYAERLDKGGREKLERINLLILRMESLINSLLHFSQVSRTDLGIQETNLNELVKEIIDIFKERLESKHIDIIIARPLPNYRCDPVRVMEIFCNLISNGLKYNLNDHKVIEIGWKLSPLPQNKHKNQVVFYVKDNGIGIPESQFENVFQIFKQLHPKNQFGEGTGVGLAIVKKLVERHGGKIWISSKLGEGTVFNFTLGDGS